MCRRLFRVAVRPVVPAFRLLLPTFCPCPPIRFSPANGDPQRFDDVIGQRGVTQTLRNAIAANRIAQSFVFSGPRGVGKTTTARILARGLNCEKGPTADPCGVCDACVEIAQGRDIDVLEIDAATNTQVDKVREVIIAGLGMAPVRNRYKIFIIDEVHRLSDAGVRRAAQVDRGAAAARRLHDGDDRDREGPGDHPVAIAGLRAEDDWREGDRRSAPPHRRRREDPDRRRGADADCESRRRQHARRAERVRPGDRVCRRTIGADDVTTVLGLVRRDLLIEMADAVAREDAPAVFELAARAIESGYDLRLVIRELARLTRDLLVIGVDPSRAGDPEIAADGERDRLLALAAKFSAEDLMRAFEVLAKAETDIKGSTQPRYHLEMALLRWIHLRKLVPLTDLIQGLEKGGARDAVRGAGPSAAPRPRRPSLRDRRPSRRRRTRRRSKPSKRDARRQPRQPKPHPATDRRRQVSPPLQPAETRRSRTRFSRRSARRKKFFYGTVIAQAQRIELEADKIVLTFAPQHRALRAQFEQTRASLEELATRLAGRRIAVVGVEGAAASRRRRAAGRSRRRAGHRRQAELRQQALADSGVQAMLDVFAAEIKDVEEM